MEVRMEKLDGDLGGLSAQLYRWSHEGRKNMLTAYKQVGEEFKGQAKRRVPVDEGRLRNSIMSNTYEDALGEITTEVGTNVPYGVYTEFGTKWIAGGAVKALGMGDYIADFEAVHNWPAKSRQATNRTSVSLTTAGLLNAFFGAVSGVQEQMPWLRTAWTQIRNWAIDKINQAMIPPSQRG